MGLAPAGLIELAPAGLMGLAPAGLIELAPAGLIELAPAGLIELALAGLMPPGKGLGSAGFGASFGAPFSPSVGVGFVFSSDMVSR